ncbi:hypothetical protein GQX73_g4333 [Xylaria multiplex]|uniref:NAD-dependent epimerase/dehydratase domain-containing protein n=1 Tax=Xylaria multiplex TaxID=323545 RepID=A0A7C8IYB1_9PEZI|nr:hypothetical protein GQX73_g4333 [Xylaria multiplex]
MSYARATIAEARPPKKTVLVTGAGGYIGFAVSRAFARAGWRVYGLVRRVEAAKALLIEEVTPVVGAISADLAFVDELLVQASTLPFELVVSCTEQIPFDEHWEHILSLIKKVAHHAQQHDAAKPLVLMSSGCKDYGMTGRHGEDGLAPHTEESPLESVEIIRGRTFCTLKVFEHPDLFDAAVVRPTPLYGYGGSYYGVIFEALRASVSVGSVTVPGHPDNIYHGCHVDDCADAYVALAEHPVREQVNGECFNISGHRYETVSDILAALSADFGIQGGITAVPLAEVKNPELHVLQPVLGYTQWVDSTKIRKLTGWTDRKPLFSENLHVYRRAYDAAAKVGDAGVLRIRDRVAGWVASGAKIGKA